MRMMSLVVAAVTLGCVAWNGDARAQSAPPTLRPPIITATGRGEAHVAADRASLTIAVETRGATASAAAAANASAMTTTLAALHRVGLTDSNLSTTGFSVGTDYMRPSPNGAQQPVTFLARNGVRVELRSPARLGTIIDSALAAGATQVSQTQFTSDHLEALRAAALAQAVERARADADAIARAAGGTLGSLIEVSTAGGAMFYEDAGFSGTSVQIRGVAGGVAAPPPPPPTPLAPSDVALTVSVTARWQFVPAH